MGRVLVLALLVAGCDHWSRRDSGMEAAFFMAATIDWRQTSDITDSCAEVNPVLGRCGQRLPVGAYFPLMLVAHAAISSLLPPGWRATFQGFTLGVETATTYWNSETMTIAPLTRTSR